MTALIDSNGIVTRWPKKRAERQLVLDRMIAHFEHGRIYPESDVNEILRHAHSFEDWALLRRELFEAGMLDRDPRKGTYWRPELDRAT